MKSVTRFEANLLRILQCFLRRVPPEQALPLISSRCAGPGHVHRSAAVLIMDCLAKGCVSLLVRWGGWQRECFLREGRPTTGRLWERTPPDRLPLTFSRHTLEFLLWITASKPADAPFGPIPVDELTMGDWLLLFFAHGILRETEAFAALRGQPVFAGNVLCQLAYPEDFADLAFDFNPDFAFWTGGPGSPVLEALQPFLHRRWLHIERLKGDIEHWQALQVLGRAQGLVLDGFLAAVEASGRFDLARFLMQTANYLLAGNASSRPWLRSVRWTGTRLADRGQTTQAALVLLRQLDRFRQWERRARQVGYYDEGYPASQWLKAEWERWQGETLHRNAHAILHEADSWGQEP